MMRLLHGVFLVYLGVFLNSVGCIQNTDRICMTKFKGICYQFVSRELYWNEASDNCKLNGGRLVKISDAATNDFLIRKLNEWWWNNKGVWIGLNDIGNDGHFVWANTRSANPEPLGSFSNWGSGHPNGHISSVRNCVRMVRLNDWTWHETFCNTYNWKYRSICQYDEQATTTVESLITTDSVNEYAEPVSFKVEYGNHAADSEENEPEEHDILGPPAFGSLIDSPKQGNVPESSSKVLPIILMCSACLLVLILAAALFKYRQRRRMHLHHLDGSADVDNTKKNIRGVDEVVSQKAARVENLYIDEEMQMFLKSKQVVIHLHDDDTIEAEAIEGDQAGGNLYEEIPCQKTEKKEVDAGKSKLPSGFDIYESLDDMK